MNKNEDKRRYELDPKMAELIRTMPGLTGEGKPFDHVVRRKVGNGEYRLECIPPGIAGTEHPSRCNASCGAL